MIRPRSVAAALEPYRDGWRRGEIDAELTAQGISIYTPIDDDLADLSVAAEARGDVALARRLADAMTMQPPSGLSPADEGRWWIGYYHARSAHAGGMPVGLVSIAEIAQRAGTTVNTVHSWRRRHPDTFPPTLAQLAAGPVWQWASIAEWLARPRPRGRPRKG